jgi:hypothetical protein
MIISLLSVWNMRVLDLNICFHAKCCEYQTFASVVEAVEDILEKLSVV